MRIYDITRELFFAPVYPGDPAPERTVLAAMEDGDAYNISAFSACCHNGTHMDAPLHAVANGDSIGDLPLEPMIGPCTVVDVRGVVTEAVAADLLTQCQQRILLRTEGGAYLTAAGAAVFAAGGVLLMGMDAISWSAPEEELAVHQTLLRAGVPLLEGLTLADVTPGTYTLVALPLKLQDMDAAPVRAVLLAEDEA